MNLNEYQKFASRTLAKPGDNKWFSDVRPQHNEHTDLIHAVFGISSEAGELVDPVKKAMFYGKPLDVENLKEEAGDLLWYIAGPLCRALDISLEELAIANVKKLLKRYPEKYTDECAIERADKQ